MTDDQKQPLESNEPGDPETETLESADWEAIRAAYAMQAGPGGEFPTIGGHRVGRRGFVAGLAAAGVPLVGLTRLMQKAGGDGSSAELQAPEYQQAAATPSAVTTPPPPTPTAPPVVASPQASPEASPVAEANPLGQLHVVKDQLPQYAEKPVAGGTLRMMLDAADTFDFNPPAMSQDFQIMASYLDTLVWIDDKTMEPTPGIAKSWTISKDGKSIQFTLRDDIKWHDGDPLTADDVVFSILVYRDATDSAVRNLFVTVDDAVATSPHVVTVTLSSPDANFIANGASQFIFKKDQFQDFWTSKPVGQRTLDGFDWTKHQPVGTGPWKYKTHDKSSITFVQNADYWFGDPPHFDTLVFTWKSKAADRFAAWNAGDIDVLWPVAPGDLPNVNGSNAFLYAANAPVVMFVAFNFYVVGAATPDLLKDVRIRQALSLAIDRKTYAKSAFLNFIDIDAAGTFPQPWLRDSALTNPAKSAKTAKQLLEEAGFGLRDDGVMLMPNSIPFILGLNVRKSARVEMRQALASIKADWAKLGIQVNIKEMDDAAFNESWQGTWDYDLIAFSYQTYPGFTDFDLYGSNWDIRINPQGWNPGAYSNADVDKAIKSALAAKTLASLQSSVKDLQVAANDDLFGLWLGFPQDLILVKPDVLGFQPTMNWQTWQTRKLWRRPKGAEVPNPVILPSE